MSKYSKLCVCVNCSTAIELCKLVNGLPILSITASIYSMVAISVERYRRVVASTSSHVFTSRATGAIIAVVWTLAVVMAVPNFADYAIRNKTQIVTNRTVHVCKPVLDYPFPLVNTLLILVVSYVTPQLILVVNYGRIIMFLRMRRRELMSSEAGVEMAGTRNTIKIIRMLSLMAVLFSLSWAPYFVILVLEVGLDAVDTQPFAFEILCRVALNF